MAAVDSLARPAPALPRKRFREKDLTDPVELLVRGARCANCVAKIERGVKAIVGVDEARFNLSTGKLTVRGARVPDAEFLIASVKALGFDAWRFDPGAQIESEVQEGRFLLTCLALSGFGVAFVVGLTDALWYGGGDMGVATRTLLSWAAASVAAPVALYAGRPFFRSALKSLSVRRANMDVPISLAIILSLGLSFLEAWQHAAQTYFDAAVMLPFLLLVGRYLDFVVRGKARGTAAALVAMQAVTVRRVGVDGEMQTIASREIAPGDRLFLTAGERTPVDGVIDRDIEADLSLVTGETGAVSLRIGDLLRAGSIVIGPPLQIRAVARVENSLLAEVTRLIEAGQQARNRYVRLADRAARLYVPLVHGLAFAVFVAWFGPLGASFSVALTNAVCLLIITCPCALGLAVPAVQVVASGKLFGRGMLVKSGDALERLAEVDVAVFDKTGTLTFGTPSLVTDPQVPVSALAEAAKLARGSLHPLAAALALEAGPGPVHHSIREIAGAGIEAEDDGVRLRLGKASFVFDGQPSTFPIDLISKGHESGGELWFRRGNEVPIRFRFRDQLRPDAGAMLAALASLGIETEILSGDREESVASAADAAGIATWTSQVDPVAKAARLNQLKSEGHRVLMVGDGLNDTAALALAHASIAPGSAIDAAQSSADIVMQGSSLWPIVQAVVVSRSARRRVVENFGFAAAYNLVAVPLAAFGLVTPLIAAIAMASSSLLVTLNALRQSIPEKR